MHNDLAYVFCLVIYIFYSAETITNRNFTHTLNNPSTFDPNGTVFVFADFNFAEKLVFNPCSLRNITSLCALYEDAFLYNRE